MDCEKTCEKIIEELQLIKNERMAAIYFATIGDFFCLCSTVQKASEYLGKDFILLYCSDIHGEILSWFDYGDQKIKSYKITEELYSDIRGMDTETRIKYQEYFVFWDRGCTEFRKITRNVSESFSEYLTKPCFPQTDIEQKYKEYIVPGRTVLLIPEAHTIQAFPIWFWNLTAYLYEILGYSVVFNVPPQKEKFYNGKSMLIPISDVVGFADTCGSVVGVRCGLFDVLSVSSAKMVIFSTEYYKSLDKVFNIENSDERIRTVYYCDDDPYFNKTDPISFVQKAFDRNYQPVCELLYKLCQSDIPTSADEYPANIIKAYKCTTIFNKYRVGRPGTDIEPFGNVMYSFDIASEKLAFSIRNLSVSDYRFDYRIFCDKKLLIALDDIRSNCVSYPLEQNGKYYIEAIITDLNTYHQECFETHRISYTLSEQLPLSRKEYANMLESACETIKHLEETNLELVQQVQDIKQALDKANEKQVKIDQLNTQCLALSEQKSQLEKKLLQNEQLTDKQAEDFKRQKHRLTSELDELRSEINSLNSAVKSSTDEINKLNAENKLLEERVAFFENSRSWRVTKPLRSMAGFFRKLSVKNKK